ncbi:MAG: hypothetical protein UV41_C0026G0005 [Candidatus Daviesbacteria bacterium GW2011_GWA2_42_7]|uniref:Resolvase helix-turn-helix domain protein n=1 Tax=Candidatus Daviesbacteria bacterium GW2011_GWA2_42_7 TaxID=1618425 RepID=A0A0G1E707_9BACT|nr:MAG: hypothetical protein UV41_C0026G0005 [Candidatus Daviesbacteria bacterium GW2011_GWA2_42_7]
MRKVTNDVLQRITSLRQRGYSLPEISREVGISKSTALRYVQDVDILPGYRQDWFGKRGGSRKRKYIKEKEALEEARNLVGQLSSKEKLLFISALYWAEGNKKDFILTNTDPLLVKVFVEGLIGVLGINKDRLQVSLRLYEDIDKERSLDFWSQLTGVAKERFINVHILPGKKKGKLEYGMCRVRVAKGGDLLKKVLAINSLVASCPRSSVDRTQTS